MADDKRKADTQPYPALEERGDERGEDPSSVTADWYGKEAADAVGQAADARRELEDDLSRLLGSAPGPEPRGPQPADDDVAFAPTQELSVLEDTAPSLPSAEQVGLPTELRSNAPPPSDPTPDPAPQGGVEEVSNEVVVFSEEQRQQLEQAIHRRETDPQRPPAHTGPAGHRQPTKKRGSGALVLILVVAGLIVGATAAWIYLS